MSRANEIYSYDKLLKREREIIQGSCDVNKDTLLRYYNHSLAEGLSLGRIRKRLNTVRHISQMLNMRFENAARQDMVDLMAKIEQKPVTARTKQDYKKILKQFYKWLRDSDEAPPEVKWIRTGDVLPNNIMKKDLLTVQEVDSLIENAKDIQDKALFSVLFDSGRRLGEILGLTIYDVEFDDLGAKLRVDGKMGKDIARVCASAPRLALWMDNHPDRNNPNSPLWISVRDSKVKQLSYHAARRRLNETAQRAGIRKRVWFYLFRHSRITPASTKLTYSQMCHVFGWKQGSDMPQFYVHLAGDDRDEAFLKMNGLESKNNGDSKATVYVPTVCPRCKRSNSPDAKYCNGCGLGLDLKFSVEADQRREDIKAKIDMLSDELAKSPEIVDKLLAALATLNGKLETENSKLKRN